MASVTPTTQAMGVCNFAAGSFTSDNTATTITLGFTARSVKVVNTTDVIVWEKIAGMAAANAVKVVAAGTMTIDTGSAVLINTNGTLTLSTTLVGATKAISCVAFG